MATSSDYIDYVTEEIKEVGDVRYRKMFGEYMVYVNDKPVLTVCDNTVYVKIIKELEELMHDASRGCPYKGAKEHYILDIEEKDKALEVVRILLQVIPVPKKKKK